MVDISDDAEVASILEQYRPLVRYIANRASYSSSTLDIDDLCQVGDMAVLRAVKAYDINSGRNIVSFVSSSVRNAIFHESARFIGALTVECRTTSQASYAAKLYENGNTDEEISVALTEKYGRNFDANHARDLRIVYNCKKYYQIKETFPVDVIENDVSIKDLLDSVVKDDLDRAVLDKRILGKESLEYVSESLNVSKKRISAIEASLKDRIKRAIGNVE